MPRIYSPGASAIDDYAHICDHCHKDDGRPTIGWTLDQGRYFDICFECLIKVAIQVKVAWRLQPDFSTSIILHRAYIPESLRNEVFARDNNKCCSCGATSELTVDHIIPFSLGGQTTKENLQTLCKKCNSKKGIKCPKETN